MKSDNQDFRQDCNRTFLKTLGRLDKSGYSQMIHSLHPVTSHTPAGPLSYFWQEQQVVDQELKGYNTLC
jgi:hypothetical protein